MIEYVIRRLQSATSERERQQCLRTLRRLQGIKRYTITYKGKT